MTPKEKKIETALGWVCSILLGIAIYYSVYKKLHP